MPTQPHTYHVGQLYNPTITHWPADSRQYNYREATHELVLFLGTPAPEEITAIRSATADFALVEHGDVMFLLSHFGEGLLWGDSPYSWWLVPESQRQAPFPLPTTHSRVLLTVLLVDAHTGILHAIRRVSLSPDFSRALHAAIQRQIERGWPGDQAYDAQIADAYHRWPTSEAMLGAAIINTRGGD